MIVVKHGEGDGGGDGEGGGDGDGGGDGGGEDATETFTNG